MRKLTTLKIAAAAVIVFATLFFVFGRPEIRALNNGLAPPLLQELVR